MARTPEEHRDIKGERHVRPPRGWSNNFILKLPHRSPKVTNYELNINRSSSKVNNQPTTSSRDSLKNLIGAVVAGMYIGGAAAIIKNDVLPETTHQENIIYTGTMKVTPADNIRTEPEFTQPGKPSNIISHQDIISIDGTKIKPNLPFNIQPVLLVPGQDVIAKNGAVMWASLDVQKINGLPIKGYISTQAGVLSGDGSFLEITGRQGSVIDTHDINTNRLVTYYGSQIGKITQK